MISGHHKAYGDRFKNIVMYALGKKRREGTYETAEYLWGIRHRMWPSYNRKEALEPRGPRMRVKGDTLRSILRKSLWKGWWMHRMASQLSGGDKDTILNSRKHGTYIEDL